MKDIRAGDQHFTVCLAKVTASHKIYVARPQRILKRPTPLKRSTDHKIALLKLRQLKQNKPERK